MCTYVSYMYALRRFSIIIQSLIKKYKFFLKRYKFINILQEILFLEKLLYCAYSTYVALNNIRS